MYLKSLTIQGFKSFAEKTELQFRSGITAVVGPNGSGKSNIADAMRWVLGEQSVKQLRGGKMEDVIFAGTQFRKPLGQASVSMTLDNSCQTLPVPYNEVVITRRLYRSGESEYLLNNNVVRLRDINELFMDTGIGREGYSMIGQGKIDAILSGKPEERRGLVEEAAGITKYKSRKEEGERKLRNAEDNLDRVEDIISTYEERIGPLKAEKEKAEVFLELSREMKDLQVSLILTELEDMAGKNEGLLSEHERLKAEFEGGKSEKAAAEAAQLLLEDEQEEINDERSAAREEYYLNKGRADELKSESALLKERIRGLNERITANTAMTEELQGLVTESLRQQAEKQQAVRDTEAGFQQAAAEYEEKQAEFQGCAEKISQSEKESTELKNREESLRRAMGELSAKEADAQARLKVLLAREESIASLSQNYDASLKLNQDGREKLVLEREELEKKKGRLTTELDRQKAELEMLEEETQEAGRALENLRRSIRDDQGRQQLLKNLEEAHEGYARSVRDLFGHLKRSKSPLLEDTDILGEVIRTAPEYSVAIEAALGAYVGNVITKTDDQAKQLIGILKKQRLGRCTFLPRNVIKARRMKLPEFKTVQVIGLASDLVETAEPYREIVDSILARTIITKNMDDALLAARETGHRIRIVTLEGDIILGGGAMTGGSQKGKSAGVVSRKAELDELAGTIERGIARFNANKAALDEKRASLSDRKGQASDVSERLRSLELEETRLNERIQSFEREIQKIHELKDSQSEAGTSLTRDIEKAREEISPLAMKIQERQQELEETSMAMATLRETRREIFSRSDRLKDQLSDYRVRATRWEKDLSALQADVGRREEEISSREKRILELTEEITWQMGEIRSIEESVLEKTRSREKLSGIMAELDQRTDELDQKEITIRARIREAQSGLETIRTEYYRLEKELLKVSMNLEKYESDKADLMTRLNEDLELTLAEARDLRKPLESTSRAKKRIREIRTGISRLGTVNLSAVEEYRKVSDHYEFLSGQREDLLRSKDDLLKLIAEMTGKMRTLFNENFVILSRNFKETFTQLFNGGTAELILGEGDVLTGNIDIHVQPPGKKLQNINLLSGGEKVLSAIALTFAILRMKPSPFCFLDEIEAALDDANVHRYARFIREFAEETQFILITHRKGTMEAANILYGVTMEEKGISKIVSVDLDDLKEEKIVG